MSTTPPAPPIPDGLEVWLDDTSTEPDLDTVLSTAGFYRLTPQQAQADLARLRTVLGTWQSKARQLGLSAEDRAELEGCLQA